MQRAADTSRFLIDFFSNRGIADSDDVVSHGVLLQHFVGRVAQAANSHQLFDELAQTLIRIAEHAFSLRDVNTLKEAGLVLANLPMPNARQVGLYYQALALGRDGHENKALALLEKITDNAPIRYRARALLTSGSIHHIQNQFDEALRFYAEAVRAASPNDGDDSLTVLVSCLNISAIKSHYGNHQEALADLEKLLPFALVVAKQSPLYFYYYHADLAYELSQVGRIAEAEAACAVALASPFATAYPEWSETRDEIAAKRQSGSHSVVAINRVPEANPSQQIASEPKPKTVTALALSWRSRKKDYFQTSIAAIAATTTIAPNGINQSILEWMQRCTGPRSPPRFPQ